MLVRLNHHHFFKVLGLFFRNKIVEIIRGLMQLLFACLCVAILCGVLCGIMIGIGYLTSMIPIFNTPEHLPMVEYAKYSLPVFLLGMVAFILIYGGYHLIASIVKWIRNNWRLAKKGIKVDFFE